MKRRDWMAIWVKRFSTAALGLIASLVPIGLTAYASQQTGKQASSFDVHHCEVLSKNPKGISFVLRLKDGKTQFKPGEIIRIELGFASSLPKTYQLDGSTYDRSGRLNIDTFHLDPPGGAMDPWPDHSGSMGGLRSAPILGETPYWLILELNEWLRFDRAGKYRLYLTSQRIEAERAGGREGEGRLSLAATSNIIDFEITPSDPAWSEQTFREALRILDAKGRQDERRASCRRLRFLGSEAAVSEMARRHGGGDDECDFEYFAGLITSPNRAIALKEMERQLEAPEHPVSTSYLRTLSQVALSMEHPSPRRRDSIQDVMTRYAERLSAVVTQKRGAARAISLYTLVEQSWSRQQMAGNTPEPAFRLSGEIASIFDELPPGLQRSLLEYRWNQIAGPAMLPVLRRICENATAGSFILEAAIRRLYELAPDEGRKSILEEISRPVPRAGMSVLSMLPDRTLPELDDVIAGNLEQNQALEPMWIHSALLARYATSAVLPRIKAVFGDKGGKWACSIQAPLLAYFLRADPAWGVEMFKHALDARLPEYTGCYRTLLSNVAKSFTSPDLEKIALARLSDQDLEAAADAASMLGQRGSPEAEEPLWQRFEQWHQEWEGRADDLRFHLAAENPNQGQVNLEMALWQAIGRGSAWLADLEKLRRLQRLCVTAAARQQVDYLTQEWTGKIRIAFAPAESGLWRVTVAQYEFASLPELKDKLAQFPRGTVFTWRPYNPGQSEEEKERLYLDLKAFLELRGLKIER